MFSVGGQGSPALEARQPEKCRLGVGVGLACYNRISGRVETGRSSAFRPLAHALLLLVFGGALARFPSSNQNYVEDLVCI